MSDAREFWASLPNPDDHEACQAVLDELKTCGCCSDHDKDKPGVYCPWIETKDGKRNKKKCSCDCRHKARWICRGYPDKPQTTRA